MCRSEIARRECQDFEGEAFCQDHQQPWQSQSDHRSPVPERSLRETRPAAATGDEVDVGDKKYREESLGHGDSNRSADKAPSEAPDKEPIHQSVQGCADQEDVERSGEETLSLDVTFCTLEGRIARGSKQEDLEIKASQFCNFGLGDNSHEDGFGTQPDDGNRDCDSPEEVSGQTTLATISVDNYSSREREGIDSHHPLSLQPDELFITRAVRLRTQRVQASRQALIDCISCNNCCHAGQADSAELDLAQMANSEDAGHCQ